MHNWLFKMLYIFATPLRPTKNLATVDEWINRRTYWNNKVVSLKIWFMIWYCFFLTRIFYPFFTVSRFLIERCLKWKLREQTGVRDDEKVLTTTVYNLINFLIKFLSFSEITCQQEVKKEKIVNNLEKIEKCCRKYTGKARLK